MAKIFIFPITQFPVAYPISLVEHLKVSYQHRRHGSLHNWSFRSCSNPGEERSWTYTLRSVPLWSLRYRHPFEPGLRHNQGICLYLGLYGKFSCSLDSSCALANGQTTPLG